MTNLDLLKAHGFRLTKPRQEVLKELKDFPQNALEIFNSLKKRHIHINLASIYRTLELCVEMGIIHVVDIGEKERSYELFDEKNHHHHLICNTCGTVQDIKLDEKQIIKAVQQTTTFKLDHHHLEFFGLCANCQ